MDTILADAISRIKVARLAAYPVQAAEPGYAFGWRGQPTIDPAPLMQTVVDLAAPATRVGNALRSIEINPLMVMAKGVAASDEVV